ncbi:MAG TPA: Holliday junction resolvase RuvX [Rhodocyclaceae bacterium]|nr:MAG: Holliday junction DNA helicase RuvA [Betaproteobacteria bacterium CG2_30_68_42]PJA56329.1 MAG: Holliday junction resolvase RuvX [Rhodocyclales bacterium CG_4_9_14_3_um_filter_68_10]HCX32494.1 Holliday junction resolvase RuvX [Rhodocyclaceae bacterium]
MPERGCVLGFDFGLRRIGVAVGDFEVGQSHPLTVIAAGRADARWKAIGALIGEWRPRRLVVGLPLSLEGEAHEMTRRCRRFANQLGGRFRLPVDFLDERLSSAAAGDVLRESGLAARKFKARLDAAAAAIILQDYLDEAARRPEPH